MALRASSPERTQKFLIFRVAHSRRANFSSTVWLPDALYVTWPQHTRQVRTLWKKLAGKGLQALVRAAPEDRFDRDHWWRNTHDTFAVIREMIGLVNAWTDLPVRPQSN